jgi:hypothetical protein
MIQTIDQSQTRRNARIAGLLYLALGITGAYSMIGIIPQLVIPGSMESTISNIQRSTGLFRLGFVSNIVSQVIFLYLVVALYKLFVKIDKTQARILLVLVVTSVPVTFVAMLAYLVPGVLLSGAEYLSAFNLEQLKALSMVFLDIHRIGLLTVEIYWGLWLLPLGILIIKSGFFPKILGYLEFAACFGYVLAFFLGILAPEGLPVLKTISTIAIYGEMPFIFWILILGARFPKSPKSGS